MAGGTAHFMQTCPEALSAPWCAQGHVWKVEQVESNANQSWGLWIKSAWARAAHAAQAAQPEP